MPARSDTDSKRRYLDATPGELFRTKAGHAADNAHHSGKERQLARSVGLFSLTMLGIGSTIGTGIFFTMPEAVPKAGPAVLISFILAGITAALTALCYAELSSNVHEHALSLLVQGRMAEKLGRPEAIDQIRAAQPEIGRIEGAVTAVFTPSQPARS